MVPWPGCTSHTCTNQPASRAKSSCAIQSTELELTHKQRPEHLPLEEAMQRMLSWLTLSIGNKCTQHARVAGIFISSSLAASQVAFDLT